MPTIKKPMTVPGGDTVEFVETSAMTNGAHAKMFATSPPGAPRVPAHVHRWQEERFDVQAGRLNYRLRGQESSVGPGETVVLPAGVAHEHWNAGTEPLVTLWTITPGLDFDYLLENANCLAAEGKIPKGKVPVIQALVWLLRMKSTIHPAGQPFWLLYGLAVVVTPIAYLFGYRAVYKRFSGEEW